MKYQCPFCRVDISENSIFQGACPNCKKVIDFSTVKKITPPEEMKPEQKAIEPEQHKEQQIWEEDPHIVKRRLRQQLVIKCPNCGFTGPGQRMVEGSIWLEIVLWMCCFIPGFIYSVWRLVSGQYIGCPKCGWKHVEKTWL